MFAKRIKPAKFVDISIALSATADESVGLHGESSFSVLQETVEGILHSRP